MGGALGTHEGETHLVLDELRLKDRDASQCSLTVAISQTTRRASGRAGGKTVCTYPVRVLQRRAAEDLDELGGALGERRG